MVGVVGIGHTTGIVKNWMKVRKYQVQEVMEVPKPSLAAKVFAITTKLAFYSAIAYGGYRLLKRMR